MEHHIIVGAGGRVFRLTDHAQLRLVQRQAEESWIIQVIENPMAIVDDERKDSRNYYGFIEGKSQLFDVAVSRMADEAIITLHFDTPATRRYERGEL